MREEVEFNYLLLLQWNFSLMKIFLITIAREEVLKYARLLLAFAAMGVFPTDSKIFSITIAREEFLEFLKF